MKSKGGGADIPEPGLPGRDIHSVDAESLK
jgi:hypothetical protein